MVFGPDGAWLASGGQDATLRLWSADDGAPLAVLPGHRGMLHGLAVDPDGQRLHSVSSDGTLRSWDVGARLARQPLVLDGAYTLAFDATGERLAASSFHRQVVVWDTASGAERLRFDVPSALDGAPEDARADVSESAYSVNACAFHPAGDRIATGNNRGEVLLHDADTGAVLVHLAHREVPVAGLAFDADGRRLAVLYADGAPRVYALAADGTDAATAFTGEAASGGRGISLGGLGFDTRGARLATPHGRAARIHDATSGMLLVECAPATGRITSVAFDRAGERVFGVGPADGLICWSARSGALLWWQGGAGGRGASRLALSDDGSRVFTAGTDVAVHDAADGELLLRWRPHPTPVYDVACSGDVLATLGHDNRVHLLRAAPTTD